MSKIVITGATGFIGTPLVKKFIRQNDEVYAVIRPNSQNISKLQSLSQIKIVPLDVQHIEELPKYVENADCFIHTAWEGIRGASRQDENLQQKNCECSMNAAKVASEIGCRVFLGIGSQAEYGVTEEVITEAMAEHPKTEYGQWKLKTYQTLQKQYANTDMKIIWARVFSAYGPGDTPTSLIETCMRNMQENKELLLTECVQEWNYIYIDDVVEAIYRLASAKECEGIYNIASGDNRSLKEYVLELKELLKSDSRICFGAVPYGPGGPVGFKVEIEKLCNKLQWKPEISFAEGIQKKIRIEESNEND